MYALEISQLRKTYSNGFEALKGIDLRVNKGDFFALLGPNGAGKSTCIGIISSLINKSSGSVKIFDHDLDTDLIRAKSRLGMMPQEFNFNIFEPVQEIIANQGGYYGVSSSDVKKRTEYLLRELGLWDKRELQARDLSGGMKRRLMIARALIHQPDLLILDEPTAGVDIELRRSMWDFMREINRQGTTIILTTHYLEEAEQMCRNLAIIDHGEIIQHTSMKALLKTLNSETFVLYVNNNLKQLPQVKGPFALNLVDEHTLEVDIPKEQSLNDLIMQLDNQGLKIDSMRNKVNRLEELFVSLINDKIPQQPQEQA
ncbi:MAG: ABC transporter ATP-binding protein [Gammaproteobacteria bacterium]|nr:ABC transporter ATP-binding protein [Gammaproteobacteria bacterium]